MSEPFFKGAKRIQINQVFNAQVLIYCVLSEINTELKGDLEFKRVLFSFELKTLKRGWLDGADR